MPLKKSKPTSTPKLETPTSDLQTQLDELAAKYQRALADYQNLIKQTTKEKHEFAQYATEGLVSQLLPLIDHLEQAAGHLKDQGLSLIVNQFHQLLASEGIELINPQPGDLFDQILHECLEIVSNPDQTENTLAEIVFKGYKYRQGRVLRPAKVKVYKSQ